MRPSAAPVLVLASALLLRTESGAAQDVRREGPTDALLAVVDADPLELARVAAREGDARVIARLEAGAEARGDVTLAAVRATPYIDAPELALEPLAELARGRDPDLAPAALAAMHDITASLTSDALVAREHTLADLAPPRAALETLAEDETARADLRALARQASASLASLAGHQPASVPEGDAR